MSRKMSGYYKDCLPFAEPLRRSGKNKLFRLRLLVMWSNLFIGLWIMISPFVLMLVKRGVAKILWEDLLLGFGIVAFSICRLFSHREIEIEFTDWLITALGLLTLINPFLYSYDNVSVAVWNNALAGGVVFLLAIFQYWKDSNTLSWHQSDRHAH